jgi:hypothetical protein
LLNDKPLDGFSLYAWDSKGDRDNLVYGSLHRGDIPVYRLPMPLLVLGLPQSRVRWSKKEACYVTLTANASSAKGSRYCSPEYAWILLDKSHKPYVPTGHHHNPWRHGVLTHANTETLESTCRNASASMPPNTIKMKSYLFAVTLRKVLATALNERGW